MGSSSPAWPPCSAAPPTLLSPSVQGEHVRGVGDQQQQAEWHPHLGSLVRAGVRVSWHPGGASGDRDSLIAAAPRRRRRSGLAPGSRDPPSAQGPATGSSEGVVGAGTRSRRGGAGRRRGGALTRSGRCAGWRWGEGVARRPPGTKWPDCPAFPGVWRRSRPLQCPTHHVLSARRGSTHTHTQTHTYTYTNTHARTHMPSDPSLRSQHLLLPAFRLCSLSVCGPPLLPLPPTPHPLHLLNAPPAHLPLRPGGLSLCPHLAGPLARPFLFFLAPTSLLFACRVGCMPCALLPALFSLLCFLQES